MYSNSSQKHDVTSELWNSVSVRDAVNSLSVKCRYVLTRFLPVSSLSRSGTQGFEFSEYAQRGLAIGDVCGACSKHKN